MKPPGKKSRKKCELRLNDSEDASQVLLVSTNEDDISKKDDVPFFICGKILLRQTRKKWVKYKQCLKWCHELCSSSPRKKNQERRTLYAIFVRMLYYVTNN